MCMLAGGMALPDHSRMCSVLCYCCSGSSRSGACQWLLHSTYQPGPSPHGQKYRLPIPPLDIPGTAPSTTAVPPANHHCHPTHVPHTLSCPVLLLAAGLASPKPWLDAALSAGYLPCLERFLRSYMYGGGFGGGPRTRAVRLGTLVSTGVVLPSAGVLLPLLQFGEERQAAALLLTLLKVGSDS